MIFSAVKYKILFFSVVLMVFTVACRTSKNTNIPVSPESADFYKKYSEILGVELTGKEDKKFIEAIAGWIGTPYLYGGTTKKGVDCSGFVKAIYNDVYNMSLYRTANDIVKNCKMIDKKDLKTGDLIFFKIKSDKVTHVGIYLNNGKFIHASSSKGVIVSNLKDAYFTKYYYSGGRIIKKMK